VDTPGLISAVSVGFDSQLLQVPVRDEPSPGHPGLASEAAVTSSKSAHSARIRTRMSAWRPPFSMLSVIEFGSMSTSGLSRSLHGAAGHFPCLNEGSRRQHGPFSSGMLGDKY